MKSARAFVFYGIFIIAAFIIFFNQSSSVIYCNDIAPIIEANCLPCHYKDGPGRFSLDNYENLKLHASKIAAVIESGYMPPWRADPTYRHFAGEKILLKKQKQLILKWINEGLPKGCCQTAGEFFRKPPPIDTSSDLVFYANHPICIAQRTHDKFVYYAFKVKNETTLNAKKFRVVTKNKKILHHAWVTLVTEREFSSVIPTFNSGNPVLINEDSGSPFDTTNNGSFPVYLPGYENTLQVPNVGRLLPPHTVVVLQIHYFNQTSVEECDNPQLRIQLSDQSIERVVHSVVIESKPGDLFIPAGIAKTFWLQSDYTDKDLTLLNITPHMHYRGKNITVFAVTKQQDTIPLVRINNWDFNWQMIYHFSPAVKLPMGSIVYARASFDNTSDNINNPVIPPVDVYEGFRSLSEMFQISIEYLDYQPGDEFLKPE